MAQGDVQDVLIWGPDGKWTSLEGPEGPAGKKATVDVGTTTTSAPGGDAAVSNSGTNQDAVFNFTIPRGQQGTKGDASTQQVGTVTTNQLNPGSDASVVINNSGTSTNATWDYTFSLAPGEKGEPGTGIQIKGQLQIAGEPVEGPPIGRMTVVAIATWILVVIYGFGNLNSYIAMSAVFKAHKVTTVTQPPCQPQRQRQRLTVKNRQMWLS